MSFDRRDILRMSSSSLALAGFGEALAGLVSGMMRPAAAASRSDLSSYDAMGLAELIRTKQIAPSDAVEASVESAWPSRAVADADLGTSSANDVGGRCLDVASRGQVMGQQFGWRSARSGRASGAIRKFA